MQYSLVPDGRIFTTQKCVNQRNAGARKTVWPTVLATLDVCKTNDLSTQSYSGSVFAHRQPPVPLRELNLQCKLNSGTCKTIWPTVLVSNYVLQTNDSLLKSYCCCGFCSSTARLAAAQRVLSMWRLTLIKNRTR